MEDTAAELEDSANDLVDAVNNIDLEDTTTEHIQSMRDIVDAICDSADAISDLIEDDSAGDPDNETRRRLLRKLQDAVDGGS